MLPDAERHRIDGLRAHAVVQDARREVEAELSVLEVQSPAHLALVAGARPRHDDAVGGGRPDPGGDRERNVVGQVGAVPGVDEALPVEGGRGADGPLDEAGLPVHEGRGHDLPVVDAADVAVEGVVGQQIVPERPVDTAGAGQRGLPLRPGRGRFRGELVERVARLADPLVELGQLGLLLDRRRRDERRRVDVLERLPPLGDVVEVGQDLVELPLRDRVELVVVAAGAAERQPEPDRRGRLDAVHRVLHEELVDDDPSLAVLAVIAVEGGGDALIARRVRQHVAGELLDGEPVEGHVGVVGVDHPVAPAPHRALAVGLVAVGVRVAGGVEPLHRHPLAVARRAEQPVDRPLVGVRGVVVEERGQLARRRRQPRQVERRPAQQRRPVGLRRRREALSLETGEDEAVDRVARPVGVGDRRRVGTLRRHERPVRLPLRPLVDPQAERLDLVVRQRLGPAGHPLGRIRGRDAVEQEALVGASGDDDGPAEPRALGERTVLDVEAQAALPARLVRPVATEALPGQDRPHLAREVDRALENSGGVRRRSRLRGGVRRFRAPVRAAVDPAAYRLDRLVAQRRAQ